MSEAQDSDGERLSELIYAAEKVLTVPSEDRKRAIMERNELRHKLLADMERSRAEIAEKDKEIAAQAKLYLTEVTRMRGQPCPASSTSDPPTDCDAPFCGCNPAWTECIEWLQEGGWTDGRELSETRAERDAALVNWHNETASSRALAARLRAERDAAVALVAAKDATIAKLALSNATYRDAVCDAAFVLAGAPDVMRQRDEYGEEIEYITRLAQQAGDDESNADVAIKKQES